MYLTVDILLLGFTCSMVAISWSYFLTADDSWFSWVPNLLTRITQKPFWHKIIHECAACISGQLALWTYPILYWKSYDPFTHIFITSTTMVFTTIIVAKLIPLDD